MLTVNVVPRYDFQHSDKCKLGMCFDTKNDFFSQSLEISQILADYYIVKIGEDGFHLF